MQIYIFLQPLKLIGMAVMEACIVLHGLFLVFAGSHSTATTLSAIANVNFCPLPSSKCHELYYFIIIIILRAMTSKHIHMLHD